MEAELGAAAVDPAVDDEEADIVFSRWLFLFPFPPLVDSGPEGTLRSLVMLLLALLLTILSPPLSLLPLVELPLFEL